MADPISIIGTVGALANIIQLAGQTITGIRRLQTDWKDADLTFLSLTGQLSALRVALTKIEEWTAKDLGDAHHQLVMDLDVTMECCRRLLTNPQDLVSGLHQRQDQSLDIQSRVKLVFGNKGIDDVQRLLEHQTNALTLLLTACHCQTMAEQKGVLVQPTTRRVIRQVNLESASLIVHRDADSIVTQTTDALSKLSLDFSFDQEVFSSGVYERYFRGFAKKILRQPQSQNHPPRDQDQAGSSHSPQYQQKYRKMLLFADQNSRADTFLHQIVGLDGSQSISLGYKLQRAAVYKSAILNARGTIRLLRQSGMVLPSWGMMDYCELLLGYMDGLNAIEPLDPRVGKAIRSLWRDPAVKKVKNHMLKGLASQWLFNDIHRIASPDYTPTLSDIERVRDSSPTVIEVHFISQDIDDVWRAMEPQVRLVDVTLQFAGHDIVYDFSETSTCIFLVNPNGGYKDLQDDPGLLQTQLLDSLPLIGEALKAHWFPRDKSLAIMFNDPRKYEGRSNSIVAFIRQQIQELSSLNFFSVIRLAGTDGGTHGVLTVKALLKIVEIVVNIADGEVCEDFCLNILATPPSSDRRAIISTQAKGARMPPIQESST